MIDYISKEPIAKGWSGNKKYCATTADGTKYLLRISPMEQYDKKKNEFEMMRRIANDFTPSDGCEKATSGRLQAYSYIEPDHGDNLPEKQVEQFRKWVKESI
ncbi:MAG: hypothetical protein PHV32_01190 [Eubacteriales bacterium]|nr:hypothetical protein [Eubacteriales bacterium]